MIGECMPVMIGECMPVMIGECMPVMIGECMPVMIGECMPAMIGECMPTIIGECIPVMIEECMPAMISVMIGECIPVMIGECMPTMIGECIPVMIGECMPVMIGECMPVMIGECMPVVIGECMPVMIGECMPVMIGECMPVMIDCGDIYELDEFNPEVTFSSPAKPELECYWFIKLSSRPSSQGTVSGVRTGHKRVPEFSRRICYPQCYQSLCSVNSYCGRKWEKSTISINNTIHIRLSTYGASTSHFTATVKLVRASNNSVSSDADLCYNAEDRGMTYAGDVDFTRDLEPCLPWHEMTHCESHPFQNDIFNTLLVGNKCRNPDTGTGFTPWCYTSKENCARNYCDVCKIGKRYDSREDCAHLKADGHCDVSVCAKTCGDGGPSPSTPTKASLVKCPQPSDDPPDGTAVSVSDHYSVGQVLTYRCNYNNSTRDRYCLSTGGWSPMGTACSECPDSSHFNKATGHCYEYVGTSLGFFDARTHCEGIGSKLGMAKTEEENQFLLKISGGHIWLGLTDSEVEGTFVWDDGEAANYTNWSNGQPDNYGNEDCGSMYRNGHWNDLPCPSYTLPFVCQTPIVGKML
ncbi:LOW QUALITY PROTEIN: metalloendopeptidase [Plakobranchus ocellatus]|uniref:Metalloendopeptidase n=1 Tax=Plakobranchus ocellatus TaxID=259542 RepID=A0AAV3YTD7_9GAST|nr:LOW QUALITY PROTEIN: metalloendopeptidase [Plakobranchus ocellatus]